MAAKTRTPAVFLDRDGVLNRYLRGDYVRNPAMLEMLPSAANAVRRLNDAGIPVIVISNQQGVAKGLMSADDLDSVDAALQTELKAEAGATILASRYCIHHSRENCSCRKPLPGLLLEAADTFSMDLQRSVFVGDTETDAQAGRAAQIGAFVLVLSGKFAGDASAASNRDLFPTPPDFVAATVREATDWILSDFFGTPPA